MGAERGAVRLSDDKARRLTRLLWRNRARRWLPAVGGALALAAALLLLTETQHHQADRTVAVAVHAGKVLDIKRTAARGAAIIHVHLDDGRNVEAVSQFRVTPTAGSAVIVNEARHDSGRLTYDVVRFGK
jgi:hypothetical protein